MSLIPRLGCSQVNREEKKDDAPRYLADRSVPHSRGDARAHRDGASLRRRAALAGGADPGLLDRAVLPLRLPGDRPRTPRLRGERLPPGALAATARPRVVALVRARLRARHPARLPPRQRASLRLVRDRLGPDPARPPGRRPAGAGGAVRLRGRARRGDAEQRAQSRGADLCREPRRVGGRRRGRAAGALLARQRERRPAQCRPRGGRRPDPRRSGTPGDRIGDRRPRRGPRAPRRFPAAVRAPALALQAAQPDASRPRRDAPRHPRGRHGAPRHRGELDHSLGTGPQPWLPGRSARADRSGHRRRRAASGPAARPRHGRAGAIGAGRRRPRDPAGGPRPPARFWRGDRRLGGAGERRDRGHDRRAEPSRPRGARWRSAGLVGAGRRPAHPTRARAAAHLRAAERRALRPGRAGARRQLPAGLVGRLHPH